MGWGERRGLTHGLGSCLCPGGRVLYSGVVTVWPEVQEVGSGSPVHSHDFLEGMATLSLGNP